MENQSLFTADWEELRPLLLTASGPSIEDLDVLVPKAVSGDPFVIADYVDAYRRLLKNLAVGLDTMERANQTISIALAEQGAMNAPFSPWVAVAGPGLGVAVYALSDIRRLVGRAGPDLPMPMAEFPDWGLEESEIRHFMRTVWKALQQSEHPLQRIAEVFGLNLTQLGSLFGVSRQAVSQWFWDEVPASRQAKFATISEITDLLRRKLKEDRIPGVARKTAEAYEGSSMLELISSGRERELLSDIRASFDWSTTA